MTTALLTEQATFVYRFYDAVDVLLYVGISVAPRSRWRQHEAEKDWWGDVARITAVKLPSRSDARVEEVRAIREERPVHNRAHAVREDNEALATLRELLAARPALVDDLRRRQEAVEAATADAIRAGVEVQVVADELGVHRNTAGRYAKERGVPDPRKHARPPARRPDPGP